MKRSPISVHHNPGITSPQQLEMSESQSQNPSILIIVDISVAMAIAAVISIATAAAIAAMLVRLSLPWAPIAAAISSTAVAPRAALPVRHAGGVGDGVLV